MNGVTIGELRKFLEKLPKEFDDYGMVNGEVVKIENEYYARVDKPIIQIEIDEQSKEFLLLHQSQEELNDIMKEIHGNT